MTNLDSVLKSRDITLPTKVCIVRAMVFLVVIYRCESWAIKKAERQRTDTFKLVLEKTLESLLNNKEIKPVNSKGNQPWIFTGRTDAEALIHWPPDAENQFTRKDPNVGKDWGQEEEGTTGNEMLRWNHWLNGHEFEQTLGDSEGQESLVCCSPWGCKRWTWLSNWTPPEIKRHIIRCFHFCFLSSCLLLCIPLPNSSTSMPLYSISQGPYLVLFQHLDSYLLLSG